MKKKKQELSAALFGCACAVIVWVTIFSREKAVDNPLNFQMFHSFRAVGEEILKQGIFGNFLGNILLFIPFGFLLPLVTERTSWWRTLIAGMLFSAGIEIVQRITAKGYFQIDDMILNTAGTLLGFGIFCAVKKLMPKHEGTTPADNE